MFWYLEGRKPETRMPIFEFTCDDCGTKFEKLVRTSSGEPEVACPSCGHDHLTKDYSTFAAHANGTSREAPAPACGSGMCQNGFCGTGACGLN